MNFYQKLIQKGSPSAVEFASNLLKNRLSSEDFKDFLLIKGSNGKNILHFAAENTIVEDSLNFLANLVESELGIEELKKMLTERCEQDLPCLRAFDNNNYKIIVDFVSLYEAKFSFAEIQKIFRQNRILRVN